MENILDNLKLINQADLRQQGKTKYLLNEIFGIAFIAMAANADDYVEKPSLPKNATKNCNNASNYNMKAPSHDTISLLPDLSNIFRM